jgi:hypothetical protein
MPVFTMQPQQEDNWCWAAVAVSINNFLDSGSATPWTQESLATNVLQKDGKIAATVDCTATPGLCDFTAALNDAFTATHNLAGSFDNGHLDFDSIKGWIEAGFPICAQIDWFGGGAHAIALDGYQEYASGAQAVVVQDPFYGPSLQFYDDLVSDYPPGGTWAETFTVKA